MATATSQIGGGRRNAYDTIAPSTDDSVLVAAVTGKRIRVHAIGISCGGTPSTVVFQSDNDAISPVFQNSISLPELASGWFQTDAGEDLEVSTGAGSNTGIIISYTRV